ncbi:MAG: hypothetical protein ACI4VD_09370, partial [Limosilactobacillus mucosae]
MKGGGVVNLLAGIIGLFGVDRYLDPARFVSDLVLGQATLLVFTGRNRVIGSCRCTDCQFAITVKGRKTVIELGN